MFIVLEQQDTSFPFGGAETSLRDKSQLARPLLRTEKVVLLAFMAINISLLMEWRGHGTQFLTFWHPAVSTGIAFADV